MAALNGGVVYSELVDNLDLFRSFVICLSRSTREVRNRSGLTRKWPPGLDFTRTWKDFLMSQYFKLSNRDKRGVLTQAKRMGADVRDTRRVIDLDFELQSAQSQLYLRGMFTGLIKSLLGINFCIPRYNQKKDRVLCMVKELASAEGIDLYKFDYSLQEEGPKLQNWLDREWPNMYLLVVYNGPRVIYMPFVPDLRCRVHISLCVDPTAGRIFAIRSVRSYLMHFQ